MILIKKGLSVLLLLLFLPAIALTSNGDIAKTKALNAEGHLKENVEQILSLIRDPALTADPKEHEEILYAKALEVFDFKTFSMLALGKKYRKFSAAQRDEFVHYFSKLISKSYFPKLAGKDVHNIKIKYLKTIPLKPKRNIYRTDISTELIQGDLHVLVDYRMIQKRDSDWKIYDIKIEGVSMVANYREQYRQQVSKTPEDIILHLREKVEQ